MPTTKARSRNMSSDSSSSRSGAVSPSQTDGLMMECDEEELSDAQKNYFQAKKRAFTDTMARLEAMARAGATVTNNADGSTTFRTTETSSSLGPVTHQASAPGQTGQYRFLVDQKTGRIVGSIPGQSSVRPSRAVSSSVRPGLQTRAPAPLQRRVMSPSAQVTGGRSPQVVDLTRPDHSANTPANQMRKQWPALTVSAKTLKQVTTAQSRRSELDGKVKSLLVQSPAKFTEWLIQQGLVRSEQYDTTAAGRVKLKLGMYPDGKKFPHTGGYVWIGENNGSRSYTSVFKGSIFESQQQAPTVLLKLLYHWSCQTNIANVANWVKVDHKKIDEVFQVLRCVCVGAVQDEVVQLGGVRQTVEIGVISLGTTTADGQKREVRVEVLGVLETKTKKLRLRATEPIPGASQSERFSKIFQLLPVWVKKESNIITDFSVDKETLQRLGYNNVSQCTLNQQAQRMDSTNQQIMDYLKKIVPKMFANTLSNLSTPVIQQFLDELTFRELFGPSALACFDEIISRIRKQTSASAKVDTAIMTKLSAVAEDPFNDWRYSEKSLQVNGNSGSKRASSEESEENFMKRIKSSKEMIGMESYYYSNLPGQDSVLSSEFKADMAFKCSVCRKLFMNNLEFMKHLHLHVETDRDSAIDMADLSQCKYCYKDFDSEVKAQDHEEKIHFKKGSDNMCQICTNCFPSKNTLVQHMMKVHTKYEMPYQCQVCGHRSSHHHEIIEHFQMNHDRTDKLQCPHCLKTYSLYTDKGYNSSTSANYLEHMQKHEDLKSKQSVNCRKCVLRFTDDKILKVHASEDHLSFKDFDNVEPHQYLATDQPTEMPKPDERNIKTASKKLLLPLPQQSAFAAQNLEDLAIYDAVGEECCECDKSMTSTNHYVAYLCCTKCRYSTCCSKAMSKHVQLFHSGTRDYNLGKPCIMSEPMFCVCGFTTDSGNKMAKHLGSNGCKSAYPSQEEANKAKVGVDDDATEKKSEEASAESVDKTDEVENEKTGGTSEEAMDTDNIQASKVDSPAVEKDKEEEDQRTKDLEKPMNDDDDKAGTGQEVENEEEKQPGQVLFGTFFNYMNDKKDDDKPKDEEVDTNKESSSQAGTEQPTTESSETMDTTD